MSYTGERERERTSDAKEVGGGVFEEDYVGVCVRLTGMIASFCCRFFGHVCIFCRWIV